MKKKLLLLLVICLAALLSTGAVADADIDNQSETIWSLNESGTLLTVTNESGNGEVDLIPKTIDVSAVTDVVFNGISTVRGGLIIGDGYRFQNCTSLKSITFNSNVNSIEPNAFEDCFTIERVTFNDNINSIGRYAFSDCTALSNVEFKEGSPETIENAAFHNCISLKQITLDENLKTLLGSNTYTGVGAFEGSGLEKITIPGSVESIGDNTFFDCKNLKEVIISDGVKIIETGVFENCASLETVTIPSSVITIGYSAFSGCSSLENISIPESVTSIENYVFSGCSSLNNVVIPDSVTSLGSAFTGCTSLESVTLSKRISSIASSTFQNCTSLKTITIPDAVTSIGANAFNGCSALTSVTTGDFINTVGASAFDNCPNLTLRVYDGSYMQTYAVAYNIPYEIIPGTEGTANGIESVTSAPGFDKDGKPCTVVTITMTNGDVEEFYIYDGEDGQDGEDGKDGEDGEDGQDGEIIIVPSFSDVPADSYYSDAVNWAVANGITTGTSNGEFSPDDGCSRAQIVTFLWRAMGSPEPTGSSSFNDVPADSYYGKAAQWALENGITTGVGGSSFGSNSTVTRAEVVTFLWRAAGSPAVSVGSFADVDSGAYYADAVAWAVANGITTGTGESTFSPNAGCTRAQIVTFLYRYFN